MSFVFFFSIAVFLLFLLIINPSDTFRVIGYSMHPSLDPGQEINIDSEYYNHNEIARGDIVAVKFKTRDDFLIKRVIALPGDKLEIKDNHLYLNDKLLIEQYVSGAQINATMARVLKSQLESYNNYVPFNSYVVLGDNRETSFDSKDFGVVDRFQIVGKAG